MRIGIVGFGSIAKRVYLNLYLNNPEIKSITIYGRDINKLAEKLENYNIKLTNNYKVMLENIDCLLIHSATVSHFEYIRLALDKRVPVYVDKPLSDDLDKSKELIELAKDQDTLLFVGYNRRYAPLYKKLKNLDLDINRIHYEKHRVDLTYNESYQTAIIDDFIHLLDTVKDLTNIDLKLKNTILNKSKQDELKTLYTDFSTKDTVITLFTARNSSSDYEKVSIDAKGYIITIDNMKVLSILSNDESKIIKVSDRLSDSQIRGFENTLDAFFKLTKNNHYIDLKQMDAEILCDDIIKSIDNP